MLRWRLAGAVVLILPMVTIFWAEDYANFGRPGIYLLPLALLFTILGMGEFLRLARAGGLALSSWSTYGSAVLIVLTGAMALWRPVSGPSDEQVWLWFAIATSGAMAILSLEEMRRFRGPGRSLTQLAGGFFAVLYISLPIYFLLQLRVQIPGRLALVSIVSVLFVVKSSDAGAYFSGRFLGRHLMAPVLSPKKTVEGAVGGVIAGMLASWMYFRFIGNWWMGQAEPIGSTLSVLGYGLTLAAAGIAGDLTESLIKRDMQQKDASSWIPGLGGTLDVVDSLLWTAPLAYLWWVHGSLAGS